MKKWYQIIACFLVSIGIWLVLNLSMETSEIVSIQVRAMSDVPGHARYSNDVSMVTAVVRASGFKLLSLRSNRDFVDVGMSSSDLYAEAGGNLYSIPSSTLYKYAGSIFGPEVNIESFITQKVYFFFPEEECVKVPVRINSDIGFSSQYTSMAALEVEPDSVLVYGDPERLSSIDCIQTSMISLSQVKRDCHGSVRLKAPAGLRLSVPEVSYYMPVTRYVQLHSTFPVEVVGAPEGSEILVYPSSVDVEFDCIFPISVDPLNTVKCVVDYSDFTKSIGGKCIVRCTDVPIGVISYSVKPEYCGCVESVSK